MYIKSQWIKNMNDIYKFNCLKFTILFPNTFIVLTKPSDAIFPYDFNEAVKKYTNTKVEIAHSESGLLSLLLAKIQKIDPDIIVVCIFLQ